MRKHVVERAYELARGGEHPNVKTLTTTLLREGYDGLSMAHLNASPRLRQELGRLCKTAVAGAEGAPADA